MGSDTAPHCEVEGAVLAARELGIHVVLVGNEKLLRKEMKRYVTDQLPIEVLHASETISMNEGAARSVRQKRDSSVRVAVRLVREGRVQGVISAGNTGAVMATAKIVLGTLPSVDRPGLAALVPTSSGHIAVMIDVGANVDCKPEQLRQFAVMGEIYSRLMLNVSKPRVGLLSIGTEEAKGNGLTRKAHRLFRQLPLNFVGNVEGCDLYNGNADVIVCDGFTGNVALKISEGVVEVIKHLLKEALSSTISSKVGYVLSRQAYADISKRLDYSEYGGAPLLGVKGVCIICHGGSNSNAIKNAIRVAGEYAAGGVNEKIDAELKMLSHVSAPMRRHHAASSPEQALH